MKKNYTYSIIVFLTGLFFTIVLSQCKKDETKVINVLTQPATQIAGTSVTLSGIVESSGNLPITKSGICISTQPNPTLLDGHLVSETPSANFSVEVTGIMPNTTYYYKAFVESNVQIFYGEELSFATVVSAPVIDTFAIVDVFGEYATTSANISSDGGSAITSRGVCWSTTTNPTINNTKTITGVGTGTFTSRLENLELNTTYYARAYATNKEQTTYSKELSFTTPLGAQIVFTDDVSRVKSTSAICGGNITNNGGKSINARGVVWGTTPNPTLSDNKSNDGTGSGEYESEIHNLSGATTYYVRAYATNSDGTVYGAEKVFTTSPALVDIDGNVYNTVVIGEQTWMAENLRVTHYNDGTAIPFIEGNDVWALLENNNTDDAYCYYEDNYQNKEFGAYYTYAAATHACPTGWHLPNFDDWDRLKNYVGNDGYYNTQGMALRTTENWDNDANGTDEYGFSGAPFGSRSQDNGQFWGLTNHTFWWGLATESSNSSLAIGISDYDEYLGEYDLEKSYGLSVRCIMDEGNNGFLPVANFTVNANSIFEGGSVSFSDLSANAPTSWSWDFGDGGTSTLQNPTHTYQTQGTYTVSLTVTNSHGSDTKTVSEFISVIPGTAPVAGFISHANKIALRGNVYFYDLSENIPTSWLWNFGDGQTSTEQNPTHTYTTSGNYTISLTATNNFGSSTETKTDFIYVSEIATNPGDLQIFRTNTAPVIDGVVDDMWLDIEAHPINVKVSDTEAVFSTPPTIQAVWDDNNIYLLITVPDDDFYPSYESGTNSWESDLCELYLDVNNGLIDGLGTDDSQGHHQFAPTFGSGVWPNCEYAYDAKIELNDNSSSYFVEYAIAFSGLLDKDNNMLKPVSRPTIGFDVTIIDFDESGKGANDENFGKLNWFNNYSIDESYFNMDGCGKMIFINAKK